MNNFVFDDNEFFDFETVDSINPNHENDESLNNSSKNAILNDIISEDRRLKKILKILKTDYKKISFKLLLIDSYKKNMISFILFLISSFLYSASIILLVFILYKMSQLIFADSIAQHVDDDLTIAHNMLSNAIAHRNEIPYINYDIPQDYNAAFIDKVFDILKADKKQLVELMLKNKIDGVFYSETTSMCYFKFPLINLELTKNMLSLILLFVILVVLIFSALKQIFSGLLSAIVERDIKLLLVNKFIYSDYDFYISNNSSNLIEIFVNSGSNVAEYAKIQQSIILSVITIIPMSILFLFILDQKMTIVTIIFISVYAVFTFIAFKISTINGLRKNKLHEKNNDNFAERVIANRLIKSSGTWENEYQKLFISTNNTKLKEYKILILDAVQLPFLIGLIMCIIFAPMIAGIIFHSNDPESLIENLTAIICITFVMISTLFPFQHSIELRKKSKISILKINTILSTVNLINKTNIDGDTYSGLRDSIEFKDLSFAYPNRPDDFVFENFNLTINQGDHVGLVGESGCGKTTLIKLLLGFYQVTSGSIDIDGVALNKYSLNTWLKNVSFIDQEPQLFSMSVFENIRYDMPEKTIEDVIEAAKKARIHDLIMNMPEKYDTILESGGEKLSGGQRQLIVFARLFLKASDVIVVDEATANLDPNTEKIIMEAFVELTKKSTVISIAHKMSLLKTFNKIVVLSPKIGIIQQASFEELDSSIGYFNYLNSNDD